MGGPSKNSVWWTVQCSVQERDAVNQAAKEAGLSRNAFVRRWIRGLLLERHGDES